VETSKITTNSTNLLALRHYVDQLTKTFVYSIELLAFLAPCRDRRSIASGNSCRPSPSTARRNQAPSQTLCCAPSLWSACTADRQPPTHAYTRLV